jgi:hypothetical protein
MRDHDREHADGAQAVELRHVGQGVDVAQWRLHFAKV